METVQIILLCISGSNFEFTTCTYFPYVSVKTGVEVSPLVPDCVINLEMVKSWVDNVDEQFKEWLLLIGKKPFLRVKSSRNSNS